MNRRCIRSVSPLPITYVPTHLFPALLRRKKGKICSGEASGVPRCGRLSAETLLVDAQGAMHGQQPPLHTDGRANDSRVRHGHVVAWDGQSHPLLLFKKFCSISKSRAALLWVLFFFFFFWHNITLVCVQHSDWMLHPLWSLVPIRHHMQSLQCYGMSYLPLFLYF